MKASILAVGTEITTGQIVNKNASWISQKLKPLGIEVSFHLTVPDDRKLITDALIFAETQADLIFVTGGLGPTSDDFTRDLIVSWSNTKTFFHEASWLHIQDRLTSRGYKVRDIQKQQCYFPENSQVLMNSQGTANGFFLETQKASGLKKVFVLPGPPREIEAIWNDEVQKILIPLTKDLKKQITKSWDTLGMGESDVATLVETTLAEFNIKDKIEIGYRVHLPYVEVKISFFENEKEIVKPFIQKLELALQKITVTKDFVDLAQVASQLTQDIDFAFYDYLSEGFLHQRLQPFLKNHAKYSWKQSTTAPFVDYFTEEENFMALLPLDSDKMLFLFDYLGTKKQFIVESPHKSVLMKSRQNQYFAEMALVHFTKA